MRSLAVVVLGAVVMSSCAFETEDPAPPQYRPASTVVINEVFALPLTNPSFYCWIEFLNPTSSTVDLEGWTITQSCFRLVLSEIYLNVADSLQLIRIRIGQQFVPDSFGVYDVPISEGSLELGPQGLMTIVSNEDRLLDHTEWGPGDLRLTFQREIINGPPFEIDTIAVRGDTTITSENAYGYFWFIQTTEQLILKNNLGQVVDVVRFGNYPYPVPDPFPGNVTLGAIPNFESISRFAGGFFTGNSANDFYVSRSNVRPTPQWYNQDFKQ